MEPRTLPKVDSNYFKERAGVHQVGMVLSTIGVILRETPNADVGIDGYAELAEDSGVVTGATIAVQIKAGISYFDDGGEFWKFYPEEKHRRYWEMYPMPVVLMLYHPVESRVYWTDVRLQLRSDRRKEKYLSIPKNSYLKSDSRQELFESCGTAGQGLLSPEQVLRHLAGAQNRNGSFPLSYLDLFLEGLTDIGRKLFFSAGMCWELASARAYESDRGGISMGSDEQNFLDSYLRFLVEQSIAHVDYSDVLIDIVDRQLYPTIVVPLTSRGRAVLDLCRKLGARGSPYEITERSIGFLLDSSYESRSSANRAVAEKIINHFGPGASV